MATARFFSSLHRRYQNALLEHPVMTNMAQSFCLWTIGDALSQAFELASSSKQSNHKPLENGNTADSQHTIVGNKYEFQNLLQRIDRLTASFREGVNHFDATRCASAGLYGGLFLGTVGHQWYKGLDLFVSKVLRPSTKSSNIFAKVFLDTFVFGPVHVSAFFSWMELSKGKSYPEIKDKLSKDFMPTFVADSAYWIPVQILNFKFVPVPLQLTIVNIACIFECAGLSFLSKFGWGGHASIESDAKLATLVEPESILPIGVKSIVSAESHNRGTL